MFSHTRIVLLNHFHELNSPQYSDIRGNLTECVAALKGNIILKAEVCLNKGC
jgi:hypothetical protein